MPDWKSRLKADSTDWLLSEENPSVRYLTLTEILDKPKDKPEVQKAAAAIMQAGTVPDLLALQNPDGYWDERDGFYSAKYTGTVWQLMILAELHADGCDPRIRKACDFILSNSQDRESGGFSVNTAKKTGGGRHGGVIPCLTGNMVWSLVRLGLYENAAVQKGMDWIVRYQRFDDGEKEPPTGWPYDKYEICFGRHSCHMGVVKALKALAAIPADLRSKAVKKTIGKAVEFLLIHRIFRMSHDLSRKSKPGWLRFGFPLMYQTDALEILEILTDLGIRDDRMAEAMEILVSRQDARGRWTMQNSFNESLAVPIEKKGAPSRWITFKAMKVMRRYYEE